MKSENKVALTVLGGLILVILICTMTPLVQAERPNYVYDWEGILTENETLEIDTLCRDIDINTTVEIVIITLVSYDEPLKVADIDEARLDYFNEYELDGVAGIGKEDKDNGVLIILSTAMADYGIEVGYGLEGDLTDGECGRIGRDVINKYYVDGDFFSMFYKAVEAVGEEIGYGEQDIIISPDSEGDITPENNQLWGFITVILPSLVFIVGVGIIVKLIFSRAEKSAKTRQEKQEEIIKSAIEMAVNKLNSSIYHLTGQIEELQRTTTDHEFKLKPPEIVTVNCQYCKDVRRVEVKKKATKEHTIDGWYWAISTMLFMCLTCGMDNVVEVNRKKVESVKGRVKRLKEEAKERVRLETKRRQEEKERREREEEEHRRDAILLAARRKRSRDESSRSSSRSSSSGGFGGGRSGAGGASGRLGPR